MQPVRFTVMLAVLAALLAAPVQVHAQAGAFDTTWRPGGRAVVVVPGTDAAVGLGVAAIGERIYVSGYVVPVGSGFQRTFAARLFATGDLDAAYGSAGAFIVSDTYAIASAAILPDGRVAYADRSDVPTAGVWLGVIADDGLARQLAGALHFAAGPGVMPRSAPSAIVVTPDGGLTIVGESQSSDTSSKDFGVMKRTLALAPVDAFTGGARTLDFGLGSADESARAVVVDAIGRTVVLGTIGAGSSQPRLGVARFLADGSLDPGFGAGGLVVLNLPGLFEIAGLAIDAQGRIVYAGTFDIGSTLRGLDMFVGRLTESGAVDAGFGTPSTGRTGVGFNNAAGAADFAYALLVQPDEAILVAGAAELAGGVAYNLAIARLTPGGSLDPTFGVGGKTQGEFSPASEQSVVNAMALDARNRLLVVGQHSDGATNIGIARITTGLPPPDPVFADGFE
jgi:uncharacterized delta-60 repeat protein